MNLDDRMKKVEQLPVTPIKIGLLQDMTFPIFTDILKDGIILAFEEAVANKLIDRPFELVVREPLGLPPGSTHPVNIAVKELVDEGCLGIIGPVYSENGLAFRSYMEEVGKVPIIGLTGSDDWMGEYCFALNPGSEPDEPYIIANFFEAKGIKNCAVLMETLHISDEYLEHFRRACKQYGISILRVDECSTIENDVDVLAEILTPIRDVKPDALVFFGCGYPLPFINPALEKIGWDPIRISTNCYLTVAFLPEGMRSIKGWYGVETYDPENPVGQAVLDRWQKRFGYRPANTIGLFGYDAANLLAYGISYAKPLTPEGVKMGLEKIKNLPAAEGPAGTIMSFGRYMRSCWRSMYFVVHEVIDGETDIFNELPQRVVHRWKPFVPKVKGHDY